MNILFPAAKPVIQAMIGFLVLQMFSGPGPGQYENPIDQATTPVAQFLTFNQDFSSLDLDRLMAWINPSFGLVKNGILLTKEEAQADFGQGMFGSNTGNLLEVNLAFNYGDFAPGNTYYADTWVEYKLREASGEKWYRFHNQFVFKIINSQWYLIQSEFIPTDANLALGYQDYTSTSQDVPAWAQPFMRNTPSETQLAGVSSWPLLIGRNFAGAQVHPLEGKTPSGAVWSLNHAVASGKPTVLYFFSVQFLSVAFSDEFDSQMGFLAGLYNTFGYRNLYIFGVTDEEPEVLAWLGDAGYNKFAPLLDDGSRLHATLNIDVHPYIVVFDHEGTVVCLSKSNHPSSHSLITDRIREVVAQANTAR